MIRDMHALGDGYNDLIDTPRLGQLHNTHESTII